MASCVVKVSRWRHSFLLASALAGSACDRNLANQQSPGFAVRDSAGIQIVENHAPGWEAADAWTLHPEPEFVIGGATGEFGAREDSSHLVWAIVGAAPLSDGRVAMLSSRGDRKVLVFERSGSFFASFGREGRGPGEFHYPEHLQVLPGDTIAVWDYMFRPVNYFSPSGVLLKQRPVDYGAVAAATRSTDQTAGETVRQPLPDGSFIVEVLRPGWEIPIPGGIYRQPTGYVRIDSNYSAHSFGWWDGVEHIDANVPFPPFPVKSIVSGGGSPLSVYVTNGDRYEIHQFSPTGIRQRILRRTVDPIPITSKDMEEWTAQLKADAAARGWSGWEQAVNAVPLGRLQPPILELRVDTQGYLWVAEHAVHGRSQWSVFDARGRWLGGIEVPATWIHWIGEDLIIATHTDSELGIESIRGYRLDRPPHIGSP